MIFLIMATGFRDCRVCGKRYEYCRSKRPTGLFVWQDVACCPEHGAIYFAEVLRAREQQDRTDLIVDDLEYDDDPSFEEPFDDSDEDIEIEL